MNRENREKNYNQNISASLPDRETYLRNSDCEDSAPLKVNKEDNEVKKIRLLPVSVTEAVVEKDTEQSESE